MPRNGKIFFVALQLYKIPQMTNYLNQLRYVPACLLKFNIHHLQFIVYYMSEILLKK